MLIRRALRILTAACVMWAGVVGLTGGFRFEIGILRVSSRETGRPLLAALIGAALLAAISWTIDGWRGLTKEWSWWRERAGTLSAAVHARWPWLVPAAAPALTASVIAVLEFRRLLVPTPLWLDEETIALNVRDRAFSQLGGPLWLGQSAPFGWLVIERAAILALGTSETALRLQSVLFGVGTVAVAAWIGRRWLEPSAGVILVILCSASQWLSHFPFEVKHYTADACWALLLPALAVWATEATKERSLRRAAIWWAAAATGQWFANGAVLVAPACALFLVLVNGMNRGWRRAGATALLGIIWIASIGVHYEVAAQYTIRSSYLSTYWAFQMVPPSSGILGGARWMIGQLGPLARNPIGTGLPLIFAVFAASGFVFASRRRLGIAFGMVPLSALAAASLRLIPLYERLVLWAVPALYVGIVLVFDRAVQLGREAGGRRDWTRVTLAAVVLVAELFVSVDLYTRGFDNLALSRNDSTNHGFDDRRAVQWLMQRRKPGDDVMSTHLGWPAVWWYGPFSIADPNVARGVLPDGGVMYEVEHVGPDPDCATDRLSDALKGHSRVLVHVGFDDFVPGFDALLFGTLNQLGAVIEWHRFADLSRAAVIDLRRPGGPGESITPLLQHREPGGAGLRGCVGVRRAQPW